MNINFKEKNCSLNNVWNTFAYSALLSFLAIFLFGAARIGADESSVKNERTGVIYTNLQVAIDDALPGDTLKIKGKFVTTGIPFLITKSLNLVGSHDAILDSNNTSPVIVTASAPLIVTLEHLTIQNGISNVDGGGIVNGPENTMTLIHVNVIHNTTAADGGGIANFGGLFVIECNIFENTSGSHGGGIYSGDEATLTIKDSEIARNQALLAGGGVYIDRNTNIITECEIQHNQAQNGGGVFLSDGTTTFTETKIFGNNALNGGGVYNDSDSRATFNFTKIFVNIITGNGGGLYNTGIANFFTSKITDNVGANGGGIFNTDCGDFRLVETPVEDNTPNDIVSEGCAP